MDKFLGLTLALALGACVYGSSPNSEGFYGNADITKVNWSKVDGKGTSCQTNWFLGLFPVGSNSVATAVDRGDIAKIAYVETDTVLYLPILMFRNCTNVYGELTPAARTAQMFSRPTPAASAATPTPAKSDYDFSAKN